MNRSTRFSSVLLMLALVLGARESLAQAQQVQADTISNDLSWPLRRFAACGATDPTTSRLFVFGGRAEAGAAHHRDAWVLDASADGRPQWQQLARSTAVGAPPVLRSCAATFDSIGRRLIVFGGWDGATQQNSVWALTVDGTPTWSLLCDAQSCGTAPVPRRAAQAAFDASTNRLLIFGGTNGTYRNDLWSIELNAAPSWSRISPTTTSLPPERGGHSMTIDPLRRKLWVTGGTRTDRDLNDTWTFDLVTNEWSLAIPESCSTLCPSPRSGATLVRDETNDQLVMFGGWESGTNVYPRDLWALRDLDGVTTWHRVSVASESPQARFFHVAGYDASRQRMIVFGGGVGASAYKDAYDLSLPPGGATPSWAAIQPSTAITARDQVAVHFQPDTGKIVAFGGFGSGTFPGTPTAGTHLADVFQRNVPGRGHGDTAWLEATPIVGPQPLQREATANASDPSGRRLFVFGGLSGDTDLADLWVLESADREARWRQLCSPTSCGSGPSARWGAHAMFDPTTKRLLVFGGRSGTQSVNDTWSIDVDGAQPLWTKLTPTSPLPLPRWGGAAGFDPVQRRFVVFGGQNGVDAAAQNFNDVWALSIDSSTWTQLDPEGVAPAPRRSAAYAMRTSPFTGRSATFLVTGGLEPASGTHHNDVWALRLDGSRPRWVQLASDTCGSSGPACRRSASAVFDPACDRLVVMFGRDASKFFDDTWSFDLRSKSWEMES